MDRRTTNTMSKRSATRVRTNGASGVRSAESWPRAVEAAGLLGGDAPTVTAGDTTLAEAALERHRP
jgi:hypothetical protein